jgi:hypothetical protein
MLRKKVVEGIVTPGHTRRMLIRGAANLYPQPPDQGTSGNPLGTTQNCTFPPSIALPLVTLKVFAIRVIIFPASAVPSN